MTASSEGYIRREYSVSMAQANIYSLLITSPLVIGLVALYCVLWGFENTLGQVIAVFTDPPRLLAFDLIFIVLLVAGVILHELIHALTWVKAGKRSWSAVQFGFQLSTLTPYAHIRDPLPIEAYRLGTLMPGLLTGLLPALAGTALGNVWLAFMGSVFVFAAGGDLLILLLLRKVAGGSLVEDHPSRAGCFVLEAN